MILTPQVVKPGGPPMPPMQHTLTTPQIAMLAFLYFFLVIATLLVCLRIGIRIRHSRRLMLSDYLLILALFLQIGLIMTNTFEYLYKLEKYRYAKKWSTVHAFVAMVMIMLEGWAIRASICALFYSIFKVYNWHRYLNIAFFVLITMSTIASFTMMASKCFGVKTLNPSDPKRKRCSPLPAVALELNSATGVLFDLYVVLSPLPLLLKMKMSRKKKIWAVCGLLLGVISLVFSICRLFTNTLLALNGPKKPNFPQSQLILQTLAGAMEYNIGIIVASLMTTWGTIHTVLFSRRQNKSASPKVAFWRARLPNSLTSPSSSKKASPDPNDIPELHASQSDGTRGTVSMVGGEDDVKVKDEVLFNEKPLGSQSA